MRLKSLVPVPVTQQPSRTDVSRHGIATRTGEDAAAAQRGFGRALARLEPGRRLGDSAYPDLSRRGAHVLDREPEHQAPFKLIIRRTHWSDTYRIDVRMALRDEEVEQALNVHGVDRVVMYFDAERDRALQAHREQLIENKRDRYRSDGIAYFGSLGWLYQTVRQVVHSFRAPAICIRVCCLLGDGTWVEGDWDTIDSIEKRLIFAIDELAFRIEKSLSYSNDEELVWEPGQRRHRIAVERHGDDTPPDQWRP